MYNKKIDLPDNPPQPKLSYFGDSETMSLSPHPEVWKSGVVDSVTYVAGKGRVSADCMVLMPCLYEEDARDGIIGSYNKILKDPPCYLKCQAGSAIKDLINSYGIENNNIYATAIVKWLLPKERRNRPTSEELSFGAQFFELEMQKIKPKLVVCLGKAAFDYFCPQKLKADDIMGGVFWSEKYSCYYVMLDPIQVLQNKPFELENYKLGLKEAMGLLKESYGITRNKLELNYQVIYNAQQLASLVDFLMKDNYTLISVDCEWGGLNPWKGSLRSLQLSWAPGHAAYIRFMDDKKNYVFDVDYESAGKILKQHFDRPEVKFVGHHFAADGVWLEQILKINTYQKCYLDTEFASQCVNEHRNLGLEAISMRYTDLGRYEMDLLLWKKSNPQNETDGYALIPDEIMFPYAMKDVDCVIRAVPFLVKELEEQQLSDYYFNYFNKFVTDVFIHFTTTGLLIDVDKLKELRILYGFAKEKLEKKFVELMAEDAEKCIREFLAPLNVDFDTALILPRELISQMLSQPIERVNAMFKHYEHRFQFNFRSGDDMRRWLFDVKQFTPFKSTPQKDKGRPSTSWEKVLQMPPEQQKLYTPSADKQTLNIFAEQDPLVARLVGLNLVGNIFKMCLKPADLDDEGNVVKENGLFFFIGADGYIRPNFSSTETGKKNLL
jgi:uracil-DNA glycosylase family 4